MARRKTSILTDLSTTDLKRLLAARERIDVLEKEKGRLLKELAAVDKELAQLMGGKTAAKIKVARKKAARKKTAKKKTAKKKTAKKKAAKKKATRKKAVTKKTTKKAAGKSAPGRKTGKKVPKKTTRRKAAGKGRAGAGRVTLEDVIVQVIKKNKGPVSFKDLMKRIVDGKMFQTRSSNFDNVLRRTLSTSKAVKRVARGVYDLA